MESDTIATPCRPSRESGLIAKQCFKKSPFSASGKNMPSIRLLEVLIRLSARSNCSSYLQIGSAVRNLLPHKGLLSKARSMANLALEVQI